MGQIAADAVLDLALNVAAYQVLLSNMYAKVGNWDRVQNLRARLKKNCVNKVAAYSSIELHRGIHVFYSGDKSHPRSKCIYETLEYLYLLTRSIGYSWEMSQALEPLPGR
ncbi:hypothetical protein MLD38_037796 [Melastoma candidum]|nr:hypothetical protein MLD38_037796 [Melastoma candidum]